MQTQTTQHHKVWPEPIARRLGWMPVALAASRRLDGRVDALQTFAGARRKRWWSWYERLLAQAATDGHTPWSRLMMLFYLPPHQSGDLTHHTTLHTTHLTRHEQHTHWQPLQWMEQIYQRVAALPVIRQTSVAEAPAGGWGELSWVAQAQALPVLRLPGSPRVEVAVSRFAQPVAESDTSPSPSRQLASHPATFAPQTSSVAPAMPAAPVSIGDVLFDQAQRALAATHSAGAQTSIPPAPLPAVEQAQPVAPRPLPPLTQGEITQVADKVMQVMQRRERFERERRGKN